MFSKFFVYAISKADISIDIDKKEKFDSNVEILNQKFTDEEILNIATFDEPVKHQVSLQHNESGNLNYNPPDDLPSFSQCEYFKPLLEAVFIFCDLDPNSEHIQYIEKVMTLFRNKPSFSSTTFFMRNYVQDKICFNTFCDKIIITSRLYGRGGANAPMRKVRASQDRITANGSRRRLQGKCNRKIPPGFFR